MKKKSLATYHLAQTLYAMRWIALLTGKVTVARAIERDLAGLKQRSALLAIGGAK